MRFWQSRAALRLGPPPDVHGVGANRDLIGGTGTGASSIVGGRIGLWPGFRFAGKFYPLPDDDVEEFKANLIALATDPMQASFALKVRRGEGRIGCGSRRVLPW